MKRWSPTLGLILGIVTDEDARTEWITTLIEIQALAEAPRHCYTP